MSVVLFFNLYFIYSTNHRIKSIFICCCEGNFPFKLKKMKQVFKKTASFTFIFSTSFSAFAQQSVEFQRSAVGQMLSGNKIVAFLGSPEFQVAVIIIGMITLAIWGIYFFRTIRNAQNPVPGNTIVGPLVSFPAELFSRGSLGTHHFGSVMPRLVPAEKKEAAEDQPSGRDKKHDHLTRGE